MKITTKLLPILGLLISSAQIESMEPAKHFLSKDNPIITVTNSTSAPIRRIRLKIQYNGVMDITRPECKEKEFAEKGWLRASGIIENLAAGKSAKINAITDAYKKRRHIEKTEGKDIKTLTGGTITPGCMKRIDDITVLAFVIQDEEQKGQYRKHKVNLAPKELGRLKKGLHANLYIIQKPNTGEFALKVGDQIYPMKSGKKMLTKLPEETLAEARAAAKERDARP